ncbi:MAG: hypothetical protein ACKV2U_29130 [Bryobacteraceae bacterium]
MALEIPSEDTGSITTIKELSAASLGKFVTALEDAPPVADPRQMAEHIAKQIPALAVERLTAVLRTLYMLYHVRELSGVKPSRFLDDLIDGIRNNSALKVTERDISKLRSILEKLMGIDTLSTISKAARLHRDGERLYRSAKILSDIRPIFGRDPSVRPVGAVLTHTLKVGYHEGSEHREFHLILDSDDLAALDEVVRRAQTKDKTLRALLKDAKLPSLDD